MLFEHTRKVFYTESKSQPFYLKPTLWKLLKYGIHFLDIFKFNMNVDFVKCWNFYKNYCMVSSNTNCVLVNLR